MKNLMIMSLIFNWNEIIICYYVAAKAVFQGAKR